LATMTLNGVISHC